MSCRDVRRVVSEYCLFGEHDELTAPHLDHLSSCRSCQDEAGVDRALVRELRRALAARVENAAPSAAVWQSVLRRAQEESAAAGWRQRLAAAWGSLIGPAPLVARLRTASVLSTMALAVLMVNGQSSMPTLPAPSAPPPQVPSLNQFERQPVGPMRIELPVANTTVEPIRIPRREIHERLITPPPPPPRISPPLPGELMGDVPEEDETVTEDQLDAPRIVWQLYAPALDPTSWQASGADGGSEPPAVPVPGQPY
jgi:hypothetical protein